MVLLLIYAIVKLLEYLLGCADIWWTKKFGKSLSGRFFGSDLQTLFPPLPPHYDFRLRSARDYWEE